MMLFAVHYECVRDLRIASQWFLYSITIAICLSLPVLMSLYLIITDGKSFEIFAIRYGRVNVNWTIINFDLKLNRE